MASATGHDASCSRTACQAAAASLRHPVAWAVPGPRAHAHGHAAHPG
jgi:hypothetical protein